jgi:hypothetical protein
MQSDCLEEGSCRRRAQSLLPFCASTTKPELASVFVWMRVVCVVWVCVCVCVLLLCVSATQTLLVKGRLTEWVMVVELSAWWSWIPRFRG